MAYFDKYGVEFSDDRKTLIRCPNDFQGGYVIPDSVTSIGEWAFFGCSSLTSIEIPDSVTSIGNHAFQDCTDLTSVTIPNSVTSIGERAFWNCSSLTSVTIPNSVTSIGKYAFYGCSGLTSVTIPNSVTSIGDKAFRECTGLTSVTIPNSVTSIGEYAFGDCTGLTSVTIPNSVTSIGEGAFSRCSSLTSITIPNSVTSIGQYAFSGCSSLNSIAVDSENPNYCDIDGVLFNKNKTIIIRYPAGKSSAKYTIPDSVTSIGQYAFSGCSSLTSVTIPNSVTSIAEATFAECTGLISVEIPNSVTSIGKYAFFNCSSLTSVTIPNNVTSIGNYAFGDCTGLTSVMIPNSVTSIGDYAFSRCSGLTSIEIPDSVTRIGYHAFFGCSSLVEIIVPYGQEERFRGMFPYEYANIIRGTSEKRRQQEMQEQQRLMEQQMQEMMQGSILFFDTETTGTPRNYKAPISDSYNWPRLVQLAWIMADKNGNVVKKKSLIIKPIGFTIPEDAAAVHGITTEKAEREGVLLHDVLEEFEMDLSFAGQIVGHNIDFDQHVVGAELYRLGINSSILMDKSSTCTMKSSTDFCAIPNPNPYFGGYKWPSLQELYCKLFGHEFSGAHDALADITATKECYFELKRRGIIQ